MLGSATLAASNEWQSTYVSLHVSWEHTYLSSLGEADGGNIICHAKSACGKTCLMNCILYMYS
jgi:hypothetical protein